MTDLEKELKTAAGRKDLSDWVKIGVLLISLGIGYARLSDKVDQHAAQLDNITQQLSRMRDEDKQRNEDYQKVLGEIRLDLCQMDRHFCDGR